MEHMLARAGGHDRQAGGLSATAANQVSRCETDLLERSAENIKDLLLNAVGVDLVLDEA